MATSPRPNAFERQITLRCVTAIMAGVVGLTFLFGFGNVWALALRLGVYAWVAPLVAPAVDLSVLGLLLATRYLALHGAAREQLRPARRLLVFSGGMTLALNVVDPLIAGQVGKAAFDAVGPLLLIGWAEVGPGLLQAISGITAGPGEASATVGCLDTVNTTKTITSYDSADGSVPAAHTRSDEATHLQSWPAGDDLLELPGRRTLDTGRHTSALSPLKRCVSGCTWEPPNQGCW